MTIETKKTVEPSDIGACEFVCRKCRAKTTRLLNADFNLPMACGNCQAPWISEGQEKHDLEIFLQLLRRYASDSRPYVLRLEIKGLENG